MKQFTVITRTLHDTAYIATTFWKKVHNYLATSEIYILNIFGQTTFEELTQPLILYKFPEDNMKCLTLLMQHC